MKTCFVQVNVRLRHYVPREANISGRSGCLKFDRLLLFFGALTIGRVKYLINIALVQSKRVKDKEMEMQAKMWQKDEKLRQLKEIVQVL